MTGGDQEEEERREGRGVIVPMYLRVCEDYQG